MAKQRIAIRFETPAELRDEFEKNISNGGIFISTDRAFEIRESIGVDVELSYASGELLRLAGEVVHILPAEMASSGVEPGIAIQFEANADTLRSEFEPLLGHEVVEVSPDVDDEGEGRREAKRRAVRVPIRVMPTLSPPFEATSRDLSATGILISIREIPLPVDEVVRICLWHPEGDGSVEIDGVVVREVANKRGRIAAVAVAFDRHQAADSKAQEVIEALSQASARSRLGGIAGAISDLGMANLVQMLGTSAPRGTIVFDRDGEQGWIAFADGDLLTAEIGPLRDHDALVAMLDWTEGRFQFEAQADEKLLEAEGRRGLQGAILAAVCEIDEREDEEDEEDDDSVSDAVGRGADWAERTFVMDSEDLEPSCLVLSPDMTFEFIGSGDGSDGCDLSDLGKVADAVLDLARCGMPLRKLVEIIPEDENRIHVALEELVESGLLRPS